MLQLKLLVSSLLLISLASCANFKTSDWAASITLPGSQDCYSFHVMSGKEKRSAADSAECIRLKERSVYIDFENYVLLRRDIQDNCQFAKCKQIKGALDNLFFTIDAGLGKIPLQ